MCVCVLRHDGVTKVTDSKLMSSAPSTHMVTIPYPLPLQKKLTIPPADISVALACLGEGKGMAAPRCHILPGSLPMFSADQVFLFREGTA